MKVKIFQKWLIKELEDEVNLWMSENDVQVIRILQSECPDFITISIFYKQAE